MWLNLTELERALDTRFIGRRVVYLTTTGSTMDDARREAEAGAAEGTVVLAEEQTKGRGRFDRAWVSPAGKNLYLTIIMRPPMERLRSLSVVTPLAVALAVEETTSLAPRIKWPNDVLVGGKKVCGILAEMQTEAGALRAVVLGIGVNLNAPLSAFPEELRDKASSLFLASGRLVDRPTFTAALLTHLEKLYVLWLEGGFAELRPAWAHHAAWMIGQQITVAAPEGTVVGMVLGLDSDGALLLQEENSGTPRRLLAGDVTVVGGYTQGVRS